MSNVCVSALLCACGGAAPLHGNPVFRRIQAEEQRIALGQAALEHAEDCDQARAASEGEVCDASEALCALAHESDDADALARCDKAEDACTAARERTRVHCAT